MRFVCFLLLFLFAIQFQVAAQGKMGGVIVIGDSTLGVSGEHVALSGIITEKDTNNPLQGATVYVEKLDQGAVTDSTGIYHLSVPQGTYVIRFRFLGMKTVNKHVIIYSSGELNVAMQEQDIELGEILIEEQGFGDNILGVATGVEVVSVSDLEQLPILLGEVNVVQSLLSLPGVTSVGEGSSGFNIRGGREDQNLVLMDGALLFNSSHVAGLFSVFNPDVTEGYSLYKGHMPVRYGGRLSSVLDVKMKQGSAEEYKVSGGIGFYSGRLMLEGPIIRDKTSFLIAGRGSYSDWILKLAGSERDLMGISFDQDITNSTAFFYDMNANISHHINENNRVVLSLYGSDDYFRYSDNFGYSWSNRMASLKWNSALSQNLFSELSAVTYCYSSSHFNPSGIDAFLLKNGIGYYKLKENILYRVFENHTINAGFEWNRYKSDDETVEPYDVNSTVVFDRVEKDHRQELAFYLGDEIDITSGISLSLGLRYSHYSQLGPARVFSYQDGVARSQQTITDTTRYASGERIVNYGGFEPRISSRFSLGPSSSVKLSYNRTRQYIHQISNSTSPTPSDIWQPGTSYLPPQAANNYSMGYYKNFHNDLWETSVEIYYKDFDNLVEYIDFARLFMTDHIETELLSGNGMAYGLELSVNKSSGKWSGWLSYAYARTFVKVSNDIAGEEINQGDWYPSNYDQPHSINLVVKRRLGERSAFSFNFTYRTGRPVTALSSNYVDRVTTVPVFSQRNEYRIPDYIRLDISFTIAENIWKGRTVDPNRRYHDSMNISFYNVLGRKNAFSVFYQRPPEAFVPKAYKLSVLGSVIPSVTYNFSF